MFALRERFCEHRLNRLADEPDLLFEDRIVVVDVSVETHWFAEPKAVARRQWQLPAGQEQLRNDWKRGHAEDLPESLEVRDRAGASHASP